MKEGISILGCGWLGFPLALTLKNAGYHIKGSKTSENGVAQLNESGIIGYKIEVFENKVIGPFDDFLSNSETLIIDIPPKLRTNPMGDFTKKIKTLLPHIHSSEIKNIIFVSSTSVYENGFPFPIYDESSPTKPESKAGKQLLKSEVLLKTQPNLKTTIIRFGGLIANDRHPARILSGKMNVKNPKAPINLIHREDCIGLILKIIGKNAFGYTINAVFPEHPSKSEYYQHICNKMELPVPQFDFNSVSTGKRINSQLGQELLSFKYKHPIY